MQGLNSLSQLLSKRKVGMSIRRIGWKKVTTLVLGTSAILCVGRLIGVASLSVEEPRETAMASATIVSDEIPKTIAIPSQCPPAIMDARDRLPLAFWDHFFMPPENPPLGGPSQCDICLCYERVVVPNSNPNDNDDDGEGGDGDSGGQGVILPPKPPTRDTFDDLFNVIFFNSLHSATTPHDHPCSSGLLGALNGATGTV